MPREINVIDDGVTKIKDLPVEISDLVETTTISKIEIDIAQCEKRIEDLDTEKKELESKKEDILAKTDELPAR